MALKSKYFSHIGGRERFFTHLACIKRRLATSTDILFLSLLDFIELSMQKIIFMLHARALIPERYKCWTPNIHNSTLGFWIMLSAEP